MNPCAGEAIENEKGLKLGCTRELRVCIIGLHDLPQQKNQHLEFHRLRGLNQATKLLRNTVSPSEQKRLLMAVSSGEVQRVDRIIGIGPRQKKGIRGLLALVMRLATWRVLSISYLHTHSHVP
ncbi:hypothetical protein CPC08DRAFT_715282 [Agrocybe pediades]|nr:hypothetical protein CPC08DRAFT_715282 [Agrocybe pediades]